MAIIMIVDDSFFARNKTAKVLVEEGFQTVLAPSAVIALDNLRQIQVDCIIADLLMPDMDGFELLKELKNIPGAPPTIIMSADIQRTSRDICLELGAVEFLNKPVNTPDLLEVIRKNLPVAS